VSEATVPRRRPPAALRAGLSLLVTGVEALLLAAALGGVPALADHPRALALVLVWAIAGVALAWSTPGRGRAEVARTREGRLGLLALGLVPLAVAPLAAYGERIGLWPLPGGAPLRWAGVALAAVGLGLRVWAMKSLGTRFAPLLTVQPGHRLETQGVYARMRHPGYAGSLAAALGAALAFGSAAGLLPAIALGALLRARVGREEALLAEHFGDEWRAYRSRTGALWPRWGAGSRSSTMSR
jgi:protein-S-isoprenylcysteine O-methyltransferase Ste14